MPKPLFVIWVARLLLSVFVPPSLMVCAVSGLEKEMAALLVKPIAPVPDEFSLLVADGPSVNWRSVLPPVPVYRSEEHTSELQSLMRISYAVFCLKKNKNQNKNI